MFCLKDYLDCPLNEINDWHVISSGLNKHPNIFRFHKRQRVTMRTAPIVYLFAFFFSCYSILVAVVASHKSGGDVMDKSHS